MSEWHRVASEADLSLEAPLGVRVGDVQIAVVKLEDGIYAINDVCTHEFALLSEGFCEEGKLECPLHQACFDVRTGKVLNEPAEVDVATYPVKVENGAVFVQVP
ncbi:non-heme iron oxygenase ferredoxin subunit [Siccirubricoccus sp. G192]|uniref:non-heme iron oxygenase ferredoxin subunit n=1 Tax=Siccirubricoccus sp. G192 TaxID=2849651 RepID=UPI001C2BC43D|nr:non-heme iron oxygenase ferredoxin subunit [Siccirubricoccus sp. G192]MBV1796125.1 non-heme iron oxygenase ferredoxin subunit [Siccirubricoccus sp. G192]